MTLEALHSTHLPIQTLLHLLPHVASFLLTTQQSNSKLFPLLQCLLVLLVILHEKPYQRPSESPNILHLLPLHFRDSFLSVFQCPTILPFHHPHPFLIFLYLIRFSWLRLSLHFCHYKFYILSLHPPGMLSSFTALFRHIFFYTVTQFVLYFFPTIFDIFSV